MEKKVGQFGPSKKNGFLSPLNSILDADASDNLKIKQKAILIHT